MTEEEFIEKYSGAPFDEEDVANLVLDELCKGYLREAAGEYLASKYSFLHALIAIGFEFG